MRTAKRHANSRDVSDAERGHRGTNDPAGGPTTEVATNADAVTAHTLPGCSKLNCIILWTNPL